MKNHAPQNLSQQRGLTIIELMIAATLGLLLLAGVLGIFISNNQAAKFTKEQATIQQDGRFAIDYIRKYMHNGGLDNWFAPLDTSASFGAEVSLLGAADAGVQPSSDGDPFDRLVLEYEVPKAIENLQSCNGMPLSSLTDPKSTRIREIFTVQQVDGVRYFGCISMFKNGSSPTYKNFVATEGADPFAQLIGGVVAFQVQYGINLSDDLYANADKATYLNATQIAVKSPTIPQAEMAKRILSMRYALLISADSDLDSASRAKTAQTFHVLDQEVTVGAGQRLPNLYTSSFKVRNGG